MLWRRNVVGINDAYYLVDTSETFDVGWESMVFRCNVKGEIKKVDMQNPVLTQRYKTDEEAEIGHREICNRLEKGE